MVLSYKWWFVFNQPLRLLVALSWIVVATCGNPIRRATVPFGIDTLIANILIVFRIRVGPWNHVLCWGPDCHMQKGYMPAWTGMPDDTVVSCANMAESISISFAWVEVSGGPKEACFRWGAHWRYLVNTTQPYVQRRWGLLWSYVDHLYAVKHMRDM